MIIKNHLRFTLVGKGPLSVEWEDGRMDRIHGATESCAFVRKLDFMPNAAAFDSAFSKRK